jgi:hypothetical protein
VFRYGGFSVTQGRTLVSQVKWREGSVRRGSCADAWTLPPSPHAASSLISCALPYSATFEGPLSVALDTTLYNAHEGDCLQLHSQSPSFTQEILLGAVVNAQARVFLEQRIGHRDKHTKLLSECALYSVCYQGWGILCFISSARTPSSNGTANDRGLESSAGTRPTYRS